MHLPDILTDVQNVSVTDYTVFMTIYEILDDILFRLRGRFCS
jgi:hypothetical protein